MPMPTPNANESESDFVSRCMGDETMVSEYPDEKQRVAVCARQFTSASLSEPVKVKIIERRENGSGVVEIPLLPATEIDLARTAGGGSGKVTITEADLSEIAANFARFPGPVPIGAPPHVDMEDRGGYAPGFVNAVSVRGGVLYGELDLTPGLFSEMASGGWRGFSVEIVKNLKTATVELTGWVLTGGILTNRPATDVHYRIAAADASDSEEQANYSIRLTTGEKKETDMSEERVAALEAELATEKETVKALRAQQGVNKSDAASLETRLEEKGKDLAKANLELADTRAKLGAAENEVARLGKELKKQEDLRKAAEIKLEAEENRSLAENVRKLAHDAIERGVSAKLFEGLDEDPVAWFSQRYANLESMRQFIEALPTIKESAVTSGNKPDGNAVPVDKETAARLERLGLNPKFVGVKSENEILALRAAKNKE